MGCEAAVGAPLSVLTPRALCSMALAMNHVAAIPEPRLGPVEPDLLASAIFLFAEELGSDVKTTLNLYMRVTALYRLLASSPSLARIALDNEEFGGALRDDALIAAARLDVYVQRAGEAGSADFD